MFQKNAFASTLATAMSINLPALLISIGMSIPAHVDMSSRPLHARMDSTWIPESAFASTLITATALMVSYLIIARVIANATLKCAQWVSTGTLKNAFVDASQNKYVNRTGTGIRTLVYANASGLIVLLQHTLIPLIVNASSILNALQIIGLTKN